MTSKKSIFKRVCSCLLAMSFIAAPVFAEETKSDNKALLQVEFLEALGVYDSDSTMMTETEDYLTRENLAVILGGFFGIEPSAPVGAVNETGFLDIEPDHWAAERIKAVADRKIMSGFSDGYFRPDSNATFEQAAKTLVVLAGHDISADISGGWSTGYMSVANELGITDGVSLGLTEPIRKGQFTQMVVNLLDAELLQVRFSTDGKIYYENTNKIFMNEILGIYVQKGIMTANDQTSLLGKNPAKEGYITVDGVSIKADSSYIDYLGHDVRAYYKYDKDDNDNELLWIEEGKKNSILEIKDEDILNPNSDGYFEYEEGNNINRVRIADILSLSVIYNGKLRNFASYQDLAPENGTVKLIDAQKDGVFETALVWNYYDYVVESVSMVDDEITIVDRRNDVAVLSISLADNYSLDITKDGSQVELSAITSGSTISVAVDNFTQDKINTVKTLGAPIELDSAYVKIICSNDTVEGALKSFNKKGYTIDSQVYNFNPYFDPDAEQVFMGVGLTAYLNYNREIVYIELSDGWNYGFVKKVAWLEEEEVAFIKIFTSNEEFIEYRVDKIRIDGETRKRDQIVEDLNESGKYYQNQTSFSAANRADCHQMIKYFLKNEKLIEIDTLIMNEATEDKDKNFRLTVYKDSDAETDTTSGNAKIVGDGMYVFPSTAKYFIIPTDMAREDEFTVHNIAVGRKNRAPKLLFDGDDMNIVPLAVERGVAATQVDYRSYNDVNMIFKELSYELNSEGDPTYILKGVALDTGADINLELENESVYEPFKDDPFEAGDFVGWSKNINGKATQLRKVFNPIKGFEEGARADLMSTQLATGANIFAGTVINKRDNYLLIRDMITGKSNIPDIVLAAFAANGKVFVFESDTKTIRQGTLNEIKTEARYGQAGADTIFVKYYGYTPSRIIIYK